MQSITLQSITEQPGEDSTEFYPDYLIGLLIREGIGRIEADRPPGEDGLVDFILTSRQASKSRVVARSIRVITKSKTLKPITTIAIPIKPNNEQLKSNRQIEVSMAKEPPCCSIAAAVAENAIIASESMHAGLSMVWVLMMAYLLAAFAAAFNSSSLVAAAAFP